jgi:hypothetical protein
MEIETLSNLFFKSYTNFSKNSFTKSKLYKAGERVVPTVYYNEEDSMNRISTSTDDEFLYLIGFRLNSQSVHPEIYTLLIYGGNDRPIKLDNQIIFFNYPEQVSQIWQLCGSDVQKLGQPPSNVELVIDVAKTLYLINHENTDFTNTILDCLNMLLDFVKAAETAIPELYRSPINSLADHLTFEHNFSSFFSENELNRSLISDAILWCIGAILVKSKVLAE